MILFYTNNVVISKHFLLHFRNQKQQHIVHQTFSSDSFSTFEWFSVYFIFNFFFIFFVSSSSYFFSHQFYVWFSSKWFTYANRFKFFFLAEPIICRIRNGKWKKISNKYLRWHMKIWFQRDRVFYAFNILKWDFIAANGHFIESKTIRTLSSVSFVNLNCGNNKTKKIRRKQIQRNKNFHSKQNMISWITIFGLEDSTEQINKRTPFEPHPYSFLKTKIYKNIWAR